MAFSIALPILGILIFFADPDDPNTCLTLTVRVNEAAEPMGVIENIVEIES